MVYLWMGSEVLVMLFFFLDLGAGYKSVFSF